jgi:metal-responsive CopG/Arc/MetJ family transcriptional regulator
MYDKAKIRVNLTLTEDSIRGLDAIALQQGLSRSELVERIGRGIIQLCSDTGTSEVAELGKFRLGSLQPSVP